MSETTSPCEDGSNGVGAGSTSLFPNAVMTGDSAVSGLSLHNTILIDADRGHKTERAETLSNNIGLDITVVVLAGPDHAS